MKNTWNWKERRIGNHLSVDPWYLRLYSSFKYYGFSRKTLSAAFFVLDRITKSIWKPPVDPTVGSIWFLKSALKKDSPFQFNIPSVEVLSVKDGWVHYERISTVWNPKDPPIQIAHMKLESFLYCYTEHPEGSEWSPVVRKDQF